MAELSGHRERGSPFSTAGFAKMVERAGVAAGLDFKAHPHMLRHACGFALANAGDDTRALQAYPTRLARVRFDALRRAPVTD
jgi:integrase